MKYILLVALTISFGTFAEKISFDEMLKYAGDGCVECQYQIGRFYDDGEGVPKNDMLAVKWYRKAAHQGHAGSQIYLGLKYVNGEGISENIIRGYAWWSIAKAQGEGEKLIESLKENMTKDQIAQAQELAAKCYGSKYKDCD